MAKIFCSFEVEGRGEKEERAGCLFVLFSKSLLEIDARGGERK